MTPSFSADEQSSCPSLDGSLQSEQPPLEGDLPHAIWLARQKGHRVFPQEDGSFRVPSYSQPDAPPHRVAQGAFGWQCDCPQAAESHLVCSHIGAVYDWLQNQETSPLPRILPSPRWARLRGATYR